MEGVLHQKRKPVTGLAKALGVSRKMVYDYFKMPVLTKEVRQAFCEYTGVNESVFTVDNSIKAEKEKNTASDSGAPVATSLQSKLKECENEIKFYERIIKEKDTVINTQAVTIKALQTVIDNLSK